MQSTLSTRFGVARSATRNAGARRAVVQPVRAAAATDDLGFKMMRKGVKEAAKETILSPRWAMRGKQQLTAPALLQQSQRTSRSSGRRRVVARRSQPVVDPPPPPPALACRFVSSLAAHLPQVLHHRF